MMPSYTLLTGQSLFSKMLVLCRVAGLLKPTSTSWNRIIYADTEEDPKNAKLSLANIMLRKLQEGLMQV